MHRQHIVEQLAEQMVCQADDFLWQRLLRFQFDREEVKEANVIAKQVNTTLMYGYEYLGVIPSLVITPLTDRCWITITSAVYLKQGAASQGPAGTGKTESTKELA